MDQLNISWQCKLFKDLTNIELYQILKLRSQVFVLEQNCVFLDMDDIDVNCHHLFGKNSDNEIVAYTRLLAPSLVFKEMSIGRVVTHHKVRSLGAGKELMRKSIDEICKLYGKQNIKIGAQLYLLRFYESFGFEKIGDVYDEDGIDHIKMLLTIV